MLYAQLASCRTLLDSIRLTIAAPATRLDLGPDIQLCNMTTFPLRPGNHFRTYLWQDGSASSSFAAHQPGTYHITVVDDQQCTLRDTIVVAGPRDCSKASFPNAFSPNGDGRNDVFIPVLPARPEQFRLTVFDRWGRKVFESTDPYKGWDGRFNGSLLPTGLFVWTCRYKMKGLEPRTEKGLVTLLR